MLRRSRMVLVVVAVLAGWQPGADPAAFGQGIYLPQLVVDGPQISIGASCLNGRRPTRPTGELMTVAGESPVSGEGDRLVRYSVEVEIGLPIDPDCFARVVELTLGDPRSWIGSGHYSVQRVDEGADVRVTLASPGLVDGYCRPLVTAGIFSCWNGSRAMLNSDRWQNGASDFDDRLAEYRTYMINHEVGHGLGHGHRGCTASGDPAPVMMQQTKTVGSCTANGWPTAQELS